MVNWRGGGEARGMASTWKARKARTMGKASLREHPDKGADRTTGRVYDRKKIESRMDVASEEGCRGYECCGRWNPQAKGGVGGREREVKEGQGARGNRERGEKWRGGERGREMERREKRERNGEDGRGGWRTGGRQKWKKKEEIERREGGMRVNVVVGEIGVTPDV